jgi:hypothetical protein
VSAKGFYYLRFILMNRPLEVSEPSQIILKFGTKSLERKRGK